MEIQVSCFIVLNYTKYFILYSLLSCQRLALVLTLLNLDAQQVTVGSIFELFNFDNC